MSVFNLKTDASELKTSNAGSSRNAYDQHAPTRDVTGDNFANGGIHFKWENSGTKWWMPSKSYMRIRGSLTAPNGTTPLNVSDEIAPNMGLVSNLFQSMEFRIQDKTVSRISDFVPQVDALETRLTKSRSWLESVGASVNFWNKDFTKRQSDVTSDGVSNPEDVKTERLELGYSADVTVAVAVTGLLTFAGTTVPAAADTWVAGDEIEIDSGAVGVGLLKYRVSSVLGDGTLQLNNQVPIALVAEAAEFRRVRQTDDSRSIVNFELVWQPPLSIFKVNHGLPLGKYELVLNPQTSNVYQKYAVESIRTDKTPNIGTVALPTANSTYKFSIVDLYFMTAVVDGPRVSDISYLIDLESTRCQSEKVSSSSFQQKNFDVSPSTYALTVAYQDLRAGTNTLVSSTKFKSYDTAIDASEELKLDRLFLNYAGQAFPSPDADPSFIIGSTDYTTQRYVESQIYSGAFYDAGGAEDIKEFHDRGAFYHWHVARDATDRSTRVQVNSSHGTASVENMRVLCFDHSRQVARITVQDSRITDVSLEDA